MEQAPILTGDGVVLRPPRKSDRDERLALGRSAEIVRAFGGDPSGLDPLTAGEVAAWLDGIALSPTAWVVEHDGRFLGDLRFHSLDAADRNARLTIGLYDPARLGRGIGRAAIRTALRHGFGPMGLHRVSLRVLARNARAIACCQACGFRLEGRERQSARVGGGWEDDLILGCLQHEARF